MVSHQHGEKGAFVGGEWVDLEDCASKFNICDGSDTKAKCANCPRSKSNNCAIKADGSYDIIIVGAGCIGSAIARELSKYQVSVLILEAGDDVSQGATKGNSGIVHAGFDDKPGSIRSKYCWPGNQMFRKLDEDLHFGYQVNGSLVVAFTPQDIEHLEVLKKRGETNGVQNLRIVHTPELHEMEPHLHPKAVAALLAPDAGNLIPYEYAIALAENAVDNGVELMIRSHVKDIKKSNDRFSVNVDHWEPKGVEVAAAAADKTSVTDAATDGTFQPGQIFAIGSLCALSTGLCYAVYTKWYIHNSPQHIPLTPFVFCGFVYLLSALIFTSLHLFFTLQSGKSGKSAKPVAAGDPVASVGTGGFATDVRSMAVGGSGSFQGMEGVVHRTSTYSARTVINCAGSGADKIANMIGDTSFEMQPRIGDYILLDKSQGNLTNRTLFPCPGPLGKGVLVQNTLWGNLILGPTARDLHNPEHMAQSHEEIQEEILSKCRLLVPTIDASKVMHAFYGVRAKSSRGDWIIECSKVDSQMVHVAGIDSPGLAGSPAIALEVIRLLKEECKVSALVQSLKNPSFNPKRAAIVVPKSGWKGLKPNGGGKGGVPTTGLDPKTNVVCKCEKVTEAEIVSAIHRSLPIDSTQAIRKRTRAGMGVCQGETDNYNCECRVSNILARELNVNQEDISRRPWPATSTLPQRWLTEEQKAKFTAMSEAT